MPNPDIPLAIILTMAGGTIAAGIIASLVQVLKRVPRFGAWLDANNEPGVVLLFSFAITLYAALGTITVWTPEQGFAVFLAWLGIAGLATKAYDVAPQAAKTMLGGQS